jgi:hypothetical protein
MLPLERAGRLLIFIYLLTWFIGSLWLMAVFGSVQTDSIWMGMDLGLYRDYLILGLAGAVGGSLYGLRMFHEYYDSLTTRWFYWYLMRPFLCFGCAILTIILFKSGILLLQVGDSMAARVGIAFLTGFGYGKFMEKIRSLTDTFFNGTGKGTGGDDERK